jgi:exodeoxyribonuclease VII small subunit
MAKKELTYGEALREMGDILKKIENEELDVDELSATVKRVAHLMKVCREKLRKTEVEVGKILKEMDENE